MRPMRRVDRQMSENEARTLLAQGEFGILATVDSDGQPYGVPLSYVYLDEAVYFHCATEGQKLDNIAGNTQVCFTVVGSTQVLPDKFSTAYESVICFGTAGIVEGQEKRKALVGLIEKYSPDYQESGMAYIDRAQDKTTVVKMQLTHVAGKNRFS